MGSMLSVPRSGGWVPGCRRPTAGSCLGAFPTGPPGGAGGVVAATLRSASSFWGSCSPCRVWEDKDARCPCPPCPYPRPRRPCVSTWGRVVCAEVWGDLSCGLSAKGMACISVGGPTAELALIPSCAAGRSGVGPVGPGKGGGVGAAEAGAPLGPEPPVQSDRDTVQGQHRPVRLGKMLPTPLAGQAAGECCVFACFPLFLFLSLVFPACSLCVRRGWRLTLQPRR